MGVVMGDGNRGEFGEGKGMSGWKSTNLGELTELVTKGTTPSNLGEGFTEFGVNFIKSEAVGYNGKINKSKFVFISHEMHEKLRRSQLKENDILFSMAGVFLGKNALVTQEILPANTNQALAIIRLDQDKALPKFIHYFLRQQSMIELINNMSGQSAQPTINFQEIKSIEIGLPNLPEQKAIAAVLSSRDDKIDLLHRQNATLEAMAETLFRQWFVEEAQEDWEEGCLNDLVDFNYGKTLRDHERSGNGYPVIGSSGVVGFHKDFLIEAPGIVTGRKGTLGVINYMFDNFFPIDTTFYITSKTASEGLFYEYFLLKSVGLGEMNSDSAVPGLNRHSAHAIPVILPTENLMKQFNSHCKSTFAKMKANQSQILTLEKLRDKLLPKLMSGEVRMAV
jgi:type I restriction enzyme, S subunit